MKKLFEKNFRRFIGAVLVFIVGASGIQTVYAGGSADEERQFIENLYVDIYLMAPVGDEWNVEIPTVFVKCMSGVAIHWETVDEREYISKCTKNFTVLIKILHDHNFNENNVFDVIRIISAVSVAYVVYSAGYVNLAKHMIYLLKRFGGRSPMLAKLFLDDSPWERTLNAACRDVETLKFRMDRVSEFTF